MYLVRERRATDFEAQKLRKGRSGIKIQNAIHHTTFGKVKKNNIHEKETHISQSDLTCGDLPYLNPTDPFTIKELQNPSHDVSELHNISDSLIARLQNCEMVGREGAPKPKDLLTVFEKPFFLHRLLRLIA